MDYENLTYKRKDIIDGVEEWTWITNEKGSWDGPKADWESCHKQTYLKYCKKFEVVVCAGGCQGMYPRLFSDMFQTVYTFEPDPLSFYCLVNNCQKDNIVKIQAALGYINKMIGINRVSKENVGMNKVSENGIVPMMTLDTFDFPSLDLLQLDVEGFEIHILEGGLRTIQKHLPVITCENGYELIAKFLLPLGYERVDQSRSDTVYVHSESSK